MIRAWIILMTVCALSAASDTSSTPKRSKQRTGANKVTDVETSCTKESLDIKLKMERPFKGIVFAKDFSRECLAQGKMEKSVNLYLPPNACGVRTSSQSKNTTAESEGAGDFEGLHYLVVLVVQMDRHLQQASDRELVVKCWLRPLAWRVRSDAVEDMLDDRLKEMNKHDAKKTRSGRTRWSWSSDAWESRRRALLELARAWMELEPAGVKVGEGGAARQPPADMAAVDVGQPTALRIKTTLPVGIGLRITDCLAHDGLGEASQKLLDEFGCPIDELIFPRPSISKHRATAGEISVTELENVDDDKNRDVAVSRKLERDDGENTYKHVMEYQHAVTTFAAFKFPDRARLHLTCGIELCKGECPIVDCKLLQIPQKTKDGLVRRARVDKDSQGIVIDRLEVYNSIEVLAPNIELEDDASIRGSRESIRAEDLDSVSPSGAFSPGDKTVCLSPSKMALAFCVLGLVFLAAAVVALVSLLRARRHPHRASCRAPLSFYSASASASCSSGLSASKLLLTDRDAPFLQPDQQSSTGNWPGYGRHF